MKTKEYYVWNTKKEADDALQFINSSGWFSAIGKNQKTGNQNPDKQKTTAWVKKSKKRYDDKYCFPLIPSQLLNELGIPETERNYFMSFYNPTIEVWDSSWFPEEYESV